MTPSAYPAGYTVTVTGASIVSTPDATELVLCNDPGATEVVVRVTPGSNPNPPASSTCAGVEPTPTTTSTTVTTPTTPTALPVAAPATAAAAQPVTGQPSFAG
jgi:hypothetical protein